MTNKTRLWNAFRTAALRAAAWPFRVAAARAAMRALARMDGRELADIGLTRSDLRDVSALALDRDPTALLALRARERRRGAFGASGPQAETPAASHDGRRDRNARDDRSRQGVNDRPWRPADGRPAVAQNRLSCAPLSRASGVGLRNRSVRRRAGDSR